MLYHRQKPIYSNRSITSIGPDPDPDPDPDSDPHPDTKLSHYDASLQFHVITNAK